MSKVATYLQEHIQGEVTTNGAILDAMSRDASVLTIKPEMVVYPRVTNDIRKIARFAFQLAEKGHTLSITARGGGSDQTGAAIGSGVVLALSGHMNAIYELAPKQKLVRVQPGVKAHTLNSALLLQGMAVPVLPFSSSPDTVGGAVSNNASSTLSGKYGTMSDWIHQLEVVLSNGDVLQTGRLSKRELNKKKGLQSFEGEIYRTIDGLIEDNKSLIQDKLANNVYGNAGYASIAQVKQKDGSFDLMPLIVGSQGTLGIVSEMILKVEYVSTQSDALIALFNSTEGLDEITSQLQSFNPAYLEYFDASLFEAAASQGKTYDFIKQAEGPVACALLVGFDDFSDRTRARHTKKAAKYLTKQGASVTTAHADDASNLLSVREVLTFSRLPKEKDVSAPPVLDDAYIPLESFASFYTDLKALEKKHSVTLPLFGRLMQSLFTTRPQFQLKRVGDKQKLFKLLTDYNALVVKHGGCLIGDDGEGRLKARTAWDSLDEDVKALFQKVKDAFDPYGILNTGVKQPLEPRQLAGMLRTDYDQTAFADYL